MNFESPDVAKDFPGLYASQTSNANDEFSDEEKQTKKKEFGWKKDLKKERKDKGYTMFEEEDSEEELVLSEDPRSPTKMKKHSKPSFKFSKKDKFYKPKEKDKEEKREKKEKERREKEEKERREREDRELREREEEHKKKEHKKKEKEEKLRFKKKKIAARAKTAGDPDQRPIFGVPLVMAVARNKCHDGIQLPAIFRDCIDFIEESGLSCEGIYRISGVKSKVQALKDSYNRGLPVTLHEHEPNVVASLLKQFLRELPEPVLTTDLLPKFEQASGLKNVMQTVKQFQALLEQLPTPNKLLLSWTIVHMTHVIANEKRNKMSLQNVSIVLSPTMQISHRLLNIFFTHSKILFRDIVIKKHVPPLRPVTSRWSLELPDNPSSLEEELRKQESLLTQLHQELLGVKDSEKEDKLWEVQRVVTQLKRKLKNTRKAQEATLAAVKREAEMKKKKEKEETEKTTGETVETPHKPDKSTSQTADVTEENTSQGEQVVTVVQLHHDAGDTVADSGDTAVDRGDTVVDSGDTVNGSDKVEVKVEPPRMTKLKAKPKSQEVDSAVVVGDADKPKKDETKGDVSEGAKETSDMTEGVGDKEGKQGKEEREGDKETVEEREEVVGDRGDMVGDRGDTAEGVGSKEETVTSVTDDTDVVTSTQVTDVDQPEETVREKEGGQDEGRSREWEREYMALMLEEEELIATGDELRQKILTEQSEMERLEQEIADLRIIHEGLYDSDELWSESSDESLDEEELQETLQRLIDENKLLEEDNLQLCSKIPEERQICLDVKVQIRMIQQWQHAPPGTLDPLIERETSVDDGPW